MKINKRLLAVTTAVTLFPIVIGLVLWNQLPEVIATTFGADNEANGFSSKTFAVFGIPSIMAALHIFSILVTGSDPKKNNISEKAMGVVYWIVPVISIAVMSAIYAISLGININIGMICCLIIGILFIVLGNYLPKVRQNHSFGVRTAWTLESDENWIKTNRLAGWLYVICGLLFVLNAFLLNEWMILVVVPAIFIPIVYSYYLYKRNV